MSTCSVYGTHSHSLLFYISISGTEIIQMSLKVIKWHYFYIYLFIWIMLLTSSTLVERKNCLLEYTNLSLNHFVPLFYLSGPCPPTNVQVSLQCLGNVGHVTWNAAAQADLYVATAIPSSVDEHNHTCTTNGTSCSLTDLPCGETAAVTVITIERGCMSEPSLPFTLHSG